MIYKKDLIKKYKESIIHGNWYRQRFDGSPHFLGIVTISHFLKSARKPRGTHFTDLVVYYSQGVADWYINWKDIKRITNFFIKKSIYSLEIGKKLVLKWQQDKINFYQKCQEIEILNLSILSDQQLLSYYRSLKNIYQAWFSMSSIIDGFALGSDYFLLEKIDSFLSRKGINKGRGKIFASLTSPTQISFGQKETISLLKIAKIVQKNLKLKKIFQSQTSVHIIKILKSDYPQIYQLLKDHQNNFFWIKNNYFHQEIVQLQDFVSEIKTFLNIDIKHHLMELKRQFLYKQKQKENLNKKFKFPRFIRNLLEISDTFTAWQDERKKSTLWAIHYFSLLLQEIGKRKKYSLEELKFFMPCEIIALMQNRKKLFPSHAEVIKRQNSSLFYYRGRFYDYYLGSRAKNFFNKMNYKIKKEKVDDFRGISASSGIARGKIVIVKSVQDINKIQKGDILVSVMTRPDYLNGLKKAIAIITDEGGITCHAAIVSRELKKPCIIGTKIATKVLKDGDFVEVDANHGVVKILNKVKS